MPEIPQKLWSTSVKGSGRTYFLDVMPTKSPNAPSRSYLVITESKMKPEPRRSSVMVFPEDLNPLITALQETASHLS